MARMPTVQVQVEIDESKVIKFTQVVLDAAAARITAVCGCGVEGGCDYETDWRVGVGVHTVGCDHTDRVGDPAIRCGCRRFVEAVRAVPDEQAGPFA